MKILYISELISSVIRPLSAGFSIAKGDYIIQNRKPRKDYHIFIGDVKDIGYILNKKNTPIKYKINNDKQQH